MAVPAVLAGWSSWTECAIGAVVPGFALKAALANGARGTIGADRPELTLWPYRPG